METQKICPGCQKPLAPNAPDGLCPACLMKAGVGTGVDLGPDSRSEGGRTPFVAPSLEEVARLFPQLDILGFLGQGGMGAVYKARQKELDRIVALKILPPGIGRDPAFAERFTREARALARLNHPGIVTLYEFGRADGLFFFLMEFVDGVTLRKLLEAGRVAPREALAIVPQICDALQYAHDAGIVHRDIKPENILLDRRGRVKVADFGLAKLVGTEAGGAGSPLPADALQPDNGAHGVTRPTDSLTDAGKIMGTPAYMAPEQAEHPGEVDHRADIYALGVVFYQMLTGELPGKRLDPPSSKVQIDVRLDEVVLRAMEKRPELRYQQVSDVKTMVESIAATPSPRGASAPPVSAGGPPKVAASAPGWNSLPYAGLALLLAGIWWTYLWRFDPVEGRWARPLGVMAAVAGGFVMLHGLVRSRRVSGPESPLSSLFFPLLVLDAVIGWVWYLVISLGVVWLHSRHFQPWNARGFDHLLISILALGTLATSAWVDFLIIRRVWRRVNKGSARVSPAGFGSVPNQASEKTVGQRRAGKWLRAAVLAACVGAVAGWAYLHYRWASVIAQFDCQAFAVDRTTASQVTRQWPVSASPDGGVLRLELSREAFLQLRQHAEEQGRRPLRKQRDIWWPRVADSWIWTEPSHQSVGARGFLGVRRRRSELQAHIQYDVSAGTNIVKLLYEGRAPLTNVLAFLLPEPRASGGADVVVIGFQVTCGALTPVTRFQSYGTNLHNIEHYIHYAHDGANVYFALDCTGSNGINVSESGGGTWWKKGEIHFRDGRDVPFLLDSSRAAQLCIGAQAYNLHDGSLLVLSEDGKVEQLPVFPTLATVRDLDQMYRLVEEVTRHGDTSQEHPEAGR